MAKAYYGSRISENTTLTPEGFRICHNVPIARTGWQDYLDTELGLPDATGKMVKVYRSEDEVFHPATIASFELKSVTDDHPTVDVATDNYAAYEKGQITNVRRGTGEKADCLVADLVIKDNILQSKIEAGKREVSCGYDADYEPIDGGYAQKNIRGNHAAIVQSGRAGPRIAIKDSKPKQEVKEKMKFIDRIKALGWKAFVQDATPEELAAAMKETGDEKPCEQAKDAEPNEHAQAMGQIMEALKGIETRLAALEKSEAAETNEPPDALDALEKELGESGAAGGESEEESVTIPAEKMADESEEEKKVLVADRAPMLALIRQLKPEVAKIKDPLEKKRVSDAMAAALRAQVTPADGSAAAYAEMLKRKAHDSKPESDPRAFGDNCAKANPHSKKKA